MAAPKITPSPLNPLGESDEQKEDTALIAAKQALSYLEPLLEYEPFKIFWTKFGESVTENARVALDPKAKRKEREKAVQIHAVLKAWYEYPMRQRAAALERVKAADKRELRAQNEPAPPPL